MCNGFMECMADTSFVIGLVTIFAVGVSVFLVGMLIWFEVSDWLAK